MRKKLIYYLLLATYLFKADKIVPIYRKPTSGIDPMSDFRSPQSLTELLHVGLIETESLTSGHDFEQAQVVLNSLNDAYDRMIDTSKLHAVYRDDRDFLQNLIDRIDSMIKDLEHRNQLSAEKVDSLKKSIDSLNVLRDRMAR